MIRRNHDDFDLDEYWHNSKLSSPELNALHLAEDEEPQELNFDRVQPKKDSKGMER